MTHEPLPHRHKSEFAAMDLGIRAAKAICDRFGAQVTDYAAQGQQASVTLRIPSRREIFHRSIEKSKVAMEEAERAKRRSQEAVARIEENRRANQALRSSLSDMSRRLWATRLESRSILTSPEAGSAHLPAHR